MMTPGGSSMMRSRSNRQSGLTLIEILVAVVVVSILAMVVIPRALGAGRAAREAALRSDLHILRQAIESYRIDTGGNPLLLAQLMSDDAPRYAFLPPDGHPIRVLRGTYRGPYLVTGDGWLPTDPMTGSRWWGYDFRTGRVWSRSTEAGLDGTTYTHW